MNEVPEATAGPQGVTAGDLVCIFLRSIGNIFIGHSITDVVWLFVQLVFAMQYLLPMLSLGVVMGVLIGDTLRPLEAGGGWPAGLPPWPRAEVMIFCGVLSCGVMFWSRRLAKGSPWLWLMLLGAIWGAGLHLSTPWPWSVVPKHWFHEAGVQTRVEGEVISGARVWRDDKAVFELELARCDGAPCQGVLRVTAPRHVDILSTGDRVRATGTYSMMGEVDSGYQFDGLRWMARTGLGGMLKVRSQGDLELLAGCHGVACWLDRWRQERERDLLSRLGEERSALVLALVTGSRGLVTPSRRAPIDAAGLSHLLAISGLHLMVLVGGVMGLLKLARRQKPGWFERTWVRVLSLCIPLSVVCIYATLAGWPVSARRAVVMFACWSLGRLFRRESSMAPSLSLWRCFWCCWGSRPTRSMTLVCTSQ